MLTKDNVETDENVECYHTNFTEGEVLHKKEKTDYITYQIICKDCGMYLDLTWKLSSVEDLTNNKILYKADGNQTLKTILDDEKFCQSLVDSCGFDGGDNQWWVENRAEEMIQTIKNKIDEVRNA